MNSMVIDRRSLLLGTLAFVGTAPMSGALAMGANDIAYVSAARRAEGSYSVLLLRADGSVVREVALSGRGHDIAIHRPSNRVAVFARRPGTFAVAFDLDKTRPPDVFTPGEGRHYFGHGSFSQDGRLLYASENDIDSGQGVIGIYDVASGFKKIGEHPSYGTGPHEIMLLADGRTIAVGNGGLDTVPDAGRENLNVDTMEPSLAFVDAVTGKLIAKHDMTGDLKSLSIRHVTQDATGLVWFGAQWEGSPSETPQLVGSAGPDRALKLIEQQAKGGSDLKGYIGAMAVSADGRTIAASAPKAGHVLYVDTATAKVVGQSDLKDVCGLSSYGEADFAASSGFGVVRYETAQASTITEHELQDIAFDNHLRRVV
ncbi:DUF1513 domain-containing protein [Hyphomicrobium sp. 99]|uniref:DUF1513 domain-containing protein n=1 Tax=Hyphomicrobium sp. 99 TaxID=1163419 RepID=UPI0005F78116|nr:DUF1513 domain-containing protein [Hyphomicrobium sp. 99]